jgi:hypothetical protein
MSCPSSRFHKIDGSGEPRATHRRVTSAPSSTTMSALVGKSKISGDTEIKIRSFSCNTAKINHVALRTSIVIVEAPGLGERTSPGQDI